MWLGHMKFKIHPPIYRVVQIDRYWKYKVEVMKWYWPIWTTVYDTDGLEDAKRYVNLKVNAQGGGVVYQRYKGDNYEQKQAEKQEMIFE